MTLWHDVFASGSQGPLPGDMLVMDQPQVGQWPPDGMRYILSGTTANWSERWRTHRLDVKVPLLVVSVSRRPDVWRMIVLYGDSLWWLPVKQLVSGGIE